jgi:autotransporter family porin
MIRQGLRRAAGVLAVALAAGAVAGSGSASDIRWSTGPDSIASAASASAPAVRISRPTTSTSSTVVSSGRFGTLPVGAVLPSGSQCASLVRRAVEVRPGNAVFNATRGTKPNARYPRVDGGFTGTTDEILQWAACKWGIDEDVVRAQVAVESWWQQTAGGDLTSTQSSCHPELRTSSGPCPESIGLMQVRYLYHQEAFEDSNAIRSSAYNVDYGYAVWRSCFNGEMTWLNTVERGATYQAGDLWGCLGVWFSGRWYTQPAKDYIAFVQDYLNRRIWTTDDFVRSG